MRFGRWAMKDHAVKIPCPHLNSSSISPGVLIPAVTQLQLIHIADAPRSHSSLVLRGFFSSAALWLTPSVPSRPLSTPSPSSLYIPSMHVFLRWLSRLEAQGSGIVSLFCWDIHMRLKIFSVLFQPPSYYLAHFIFCLSVLILILILYIVYVLSQCSLFLCASPNLLAVSATCSPVHLFSFIRTDLLLWLSDTFSRCTAQCN